ncbi:MAG: hypothetical protein QXV45_05820, partial [Candidatus Bathyarchaeia archaeon]
RRLDGHEAELVRLREETGRIWEEIARLREDMNRLREDMIAGFRRHDEILAKHGEEMAKLREDMIAGFRRHDEEMARMRRDIRDLKVTMERMVLSEEEEAREVLGHRLKALGIHRALKRLELPGLEIDLYGTSDGICLIGEAAVRAGAGLVEELDAKAELLARRHPELLRPNLIKAIYTIIATPEAIEEANRRGVWVLDWKGDLSKGPKPA